MPTDTDRPDPRGRGTTSTLAQNSEEQPAEAPHGSASPSRPGSRLNPRPVRAPGVPRRRAGRRQAPPPR